MTSHRCQGWPVRAALVDKPERYRWSSVRGNLGLLADPLLSPHPVFLGLGADAGLRGHTYRQWLMQGTHPDELQAIRNHLDQELALGDPRFQSMVEKMLGRPVEWRPRGRPVRNQSA